MKISFFNAKSYDRAFFDRANRLHGHQLAYLEPRLTLETAPLAAASPVVCAFVNDHLDAPVLEMLAAGGTHLVALRSSGYNHVDLATAARLGITVVHVPRYSPHAVAEHTLGLILALNRHLPRAYQRVRDGNFSIAGLLGFDLHGKTAGLVGVGRIGTCVGRILRGFGCRVLAHDPHPLPEARAAGFHFCEKDELLGAADIVSLHCPLNAETRHLIDTTTLARMRRGVMLINTSRGALVDTPAVLAALLTGQVGYLGLDVYEDEGELLYEDHSDALLRDGVLSRLLTLPNVLVTGHQGFFTREALATIAETTLASVTAFAAGRTCTYALPPPANAFDHEETASFDGGNDQGRGAPLSVRG
ncbi:MAG TPA: 2-hydroxyacid dehydrogenase [Opitutaceae bacterium]|nr:2-hydroxyacid dehydrogenase [Opitutaceae bacterium]